MTKEKAIKQFETLLFHVDTDCVMGMETTEAINMAIKALEQPEPCEDAVSRKAVIDCVRQDCFAVFTADERACEIKDLPPVTPKQRTGKWIVPSQVPDMVRGCWAKCSACGHSTFGGGKFCRECGAKMEGVSNESD